MQHGHGDPQATRTALAVIAGGGEEGCEGDLYELGGDEGGGEKGLLGARLCVCSSHGEPAVSTLGGRAEQGRLRVRIAALAGGLPAGEGGKTKYDKKEWGRQQRRAKRSWRRGAGGRRWPARRRSSRASRGTPRHTFTTLITFITFIIVIIITTIIIGTMASTPSLALSYATLLSTLHERASLLAAPSSTVPPSLNRTIKRQIDAFARAVEGAKLSSNAEWQDARMKWERIEEGLQADEEGRKVLLSARDR